MENLKMSELREGMVVVAHGMELLLTKPYFREHGAMMPDKVYGFTGIIQNLEEVEAEGTVPASYRRNNEWILQGNDYVSYQRVR